MNSEQKRLFESVIGELANLINFKLVSLLCVERVILTREQVEQCKELSNDFSRSIKLLHLVLESRLPTIFDIFIRILEETGNKKAISLLQPTKFGKFLYKMSETFGSPTSGYPLGMDSNKSKVIFDSSRSTSGFDGDNSFSSPLKERHQATLISSSSSSGGASAQDSGNYRDNGFISNAATSHNNSSSYTLPAAFPQSQPQPQPSTSSSNQHLNQDQSSFKATPNSSFKLKQTGQNNFTSQSCQTPATRPRDLGSMKNLTIGDLEGEGQKGANGEPVVCWHPYARPQDAHRSGASSPHCCHPSYVSSSSDSDCSSDSLSVDPNLILNPNVTMAIAKDGPNMMRVRKTTSYHYNSEEDYKMTARPRGPCLIVNNIDFEGEIFPTRKGSDEDARRFDSIFDQLGFTVIMRRNQTADQMRDLFREVAAECKPEHDSVFVFILSHGSEYGIYGTDGLEVDLEKEIIECFDNRNCKAMMGKPKVFVIQACRGRSKDFGGGEGDATDSIAWPPVSTSPSGSLIKTNSQENRVPDSWLQRYQPQDGKKRKMPIRTDMLLVFSCLAGFVSVRNELAGSWLGVALAYFIMTHAHERDLLRILNLVTSDVIQRESSHGHIQSIELKLLGWTKNLYFNPGIYI